jgi:pimeloyl-ACP methyl ester carboxylesterase
MSLLDHLGIATAKAIAMSMGAKTLLHIATMQPHRMQAMVLVSATPYFPPRLRETAAHRPRRHLSVCRMPSTTRCAVGTSMAISKSYGSM